MNQPGLAQSKPIIAVTRRFQDIDQLEYFSNYHRAVKLTQMSLQRLRCDFTLVDFDEARFIFAEACCPVRCVGDKAKDFIEFSLALKADQLGVLSHGYRLSAQTLWGFDSDRETRIVVPPGQLCCFLQLKRSLVKDCLEAIDRPEIGDRKFLAKNYVYMPTTLPPLKLYLNELLTLLHLQPGFLQQPQLKQLVLEDFVPLLLNSIPPEEEPESGLSALSRAQIVRATEDYMMAHLDQPLTLKTLCRAINTSERPLFYGFQEIFGLSPMAFLKVQRLHSVRHALRFADPDDITIQHIAQRFGFWNMGHFSKDYKLMFGERPSDTLNRPVRQGQSGMRI